MREPNGQQKLFIEEHIRLRKKNATKAAINAGYSKKSASSQAYQLLQNPIVARYLHKRESQIMQELQEEFLFDAIEARKVMYSILKDEEARDIDRINVAKDFLDRAGFKPIENIQHSGSIDISERTKQIERELFGDGEKI